MGVDDDITRDDVIEVHLFSSSLLGHLVFFYVFVQYCITLLIRCNN